MFPIVRHTLFLVHTNYLFTTKINVLFNDVCMGQVFSNGTDDCRWQSDLNETCGQNALKQYADMLIWVVSK